jgi:signal transduction histidine kinase
MSHELRTPLNAIIGYTEIVLAGMTGDLTEEQRDYHERVLANGEHLLNLINDVLDLSKVEAGRMEILRNPFEVRRWLSDIVQQMRGMAEDKDLAFNVTLDDHLPDGIVGDPERLKQVVLNLISNAIKFTDQGSVELTAYKRDRETWAVDVTDSGIGIPPHAQEYIFDEFRQIDGTSMRKYGGTGLGLAIVRNLTSMMGGNVRVKSTVGEGSTFTVVLPLVVAEEATLTSPGAELAGVSSNHDNKS